MFLVGHGMAAGFISVRTGVVKEIGRFGRYLPKAGRPLKSPTMEGLAFESFDRKFLVYSKWEPNDEIWKVPIAGGQ